MRITEIIERFGGVCEGDASIDVRGVMGVEFAGPDDATFATDDKRLAEAEASPACCVLAPRAIRRSSKTLLRCDSPQRYAADLLELFHPAPQVSPGVHASAIVGEESQIDPRASIGAYVTVGKACRIAAGVTLMAGVAVGDGCEIGADSVLHPHVTLYASTRIGARVIVHAGAVIGADGFGYFKDGDTLRKWPHIGCVVIEDDVEIGANACIDRAKFGVTLIQRGAKIDNLVQIAHNCQIGRNAVLAGQTGLAGSVVIGDWVACGGQSGVTDHNIIGQGASLAAQTGVINEIPPGTAVGGFPARPFRQLMQETAMLKWLNEHRAVLRRLVHQASGYARGNEE